MHMGIFRIDCILPSVHLCESVPLSYSPPIFTGTLCTCHQESVADMQSVSINFHPLEIAVWRGRGFVGASGFQQP
jgi:hypothetical protein